MLTLSKKGNAVYILYAAKKFESGKTVTAKVWNAANTAISGSPFTLTEISTNTGLYGVSFTPTVIGEYKIQILEGGIEQAAASIKVTDYDIESIGGDVTSIKSLLDNATYGNSALNDKLDAMAGTGFVSADDSLNAIKDYLVNTIQSSISQIQNNTLTSVAMSTEMIRPSAGSSLFKVFVNVYDNEGMMQDPDDQDSGAGTAMIAVDALDESGNSRISNVSGLDASTQDSKKWLTRVSAGRFSCIYSVSNTHDLEQINFSFTYKVAGSDRIIDRSSTVSEVVDLTSLVTDIKNEVTDATYGLAAIKTLIDSYQSTNDGNFITLDGKLDTISGVAGDNYSLLSNGTHGLAALKTLVDNLSSSVTSIKGTGYVQANDSLKAVSDRQQTIMGAGFDTGTDTLEKIREAIDSVGTTNGGYIA